MVRMLSHFSDSMSDGIGFIWSLAVWSSDRSLVRFLVVVVSVVAADAGAGIWVVIVVVADVIVERRNRKEGVPCKNLRRGEDIIVSPSAST